MWGWIEYPYNGWVMLHEEKRLKNGILSQKTFWQHVQLTSPISYGQYFESHPIWTIDNILYYSWPSYPFNILRTQCIPMIFRYQFFLFIAVIFEELLCAYFHYTTVTIVDREQQQHRSNFRFLSLLLHCIIAKKKEHRNGYYRYCYHHNHFSCSKGKSSNRKRRGNNRLYGWKIHASRVKYSEWITCWGYVC